MDDSFYIDLKRPEDGGERTAYFVLESLLKARIDCGFESNSVGYDEDVNVYLVHLLLSITEPGGPVALSLSPDTDVFARVRDSIDPLFKGEVYRTSADGLLLSTGIFNDTPYTRHDGQRCFESGTRDRIGRGKAYYGYAASFHDQRASSAGGMSDILYKLSSRFERYVNVLFHMRGAYFHLYERLSDAELARLHRSGENAPREEEPESFEEARNAFLDAYWAWHQSSDPASRLAVSEAAERLRALDPSFDFQIPEN